MAYKPTIGLEIHAELKTRTKMFCACKNDPEEKSPNTNVCPVCLGYPGTLPVVNKEAVMHVLRVGKALGAVLADFTEFDRKNYFYPDIPKGYQISQYKYPLVSGGSLGGVAVTRVHLEEDTARSSHDKGEYSVVDFNRAGLPLMELVTEPVIHSAEEAGVFARELQLLLRTLGASDANMEKGEMRVEANISISMSDMLLGTKVEVKNINSFRAVEKAIKYEIERHERVLESGEKIIQETRGWDESTQKTFSQRKKENSHDYRYFPDPDIPKLKLSELSEVKSIELPELPWQKRDRFKGDFGIKSEDIEMYLADAVLGSFFESVMRVLSDKTLGVLVSNYVTSDLAGLMKNNPTVNTYEKIPPKNFASLIKMLKQSKISSRGAKDILTEMFIKGGLPEEIAEEKGLLQKSGEGELSSIVEKIISDNPAVVAEYKAGKESSIQFLIGQGMQASKGSANPSILKSLLTAKLTQGL